MYIACIYLQAIDTLRQVPRGTVNLSIDKCAKMSEASPNDVKVEISKTEEKTVCKLHITWNG